MLAKISGCKGLRACVFLSVSYPLGELVTRPGRASTLACSASGDSKLD